MGNIYVAVNYGREGWSLTQVKNEREAVSFIKSGESHGHEAKIFRELDIFIADRPEGKEEYNE